MYLRFNSSNKTWSQRFSLMRFSISRKRASLWRYTVFSSIVQYSVCFNARLEKK